MSFRAAVKMKARRRLAREICRALETGLTMTDVAEISEISAAAVRDNRGLGRPEPRLPDPGRGRES